jgi:hypothetical protein
VFNRFKINRSVNRIIEDKYYEQVAFEMTQGNINIGTWTRAKVNAEGDKKKTEALYIKYRVQTLHDEVHAISTLNDELNKKNSYIEKPIKKITPVKKVENPVIKPNNIKNIEPLQGKNLALARSAVINGDLIYIEFYSCDFSSETLDLLIEYSELCGEDEIYNYLIKQPKPPVSEKEKPHYDDDVQEIIDIVENTKW